jgi:hypothetical protein
VTLSAAFGHLAKLHKMAGGDSAVPSQLRQALVSSVPFEHQGNAALIAPHPGY